MKELQLLLLSILFTILLCSCVIQADTEDDSYIYDESYGNFWAVNFKNDRYYRVNAELITEGKYCTIWAEKGSGIYRARAEGIAKEFDENIYNQMLDAFGIQKNFIYEGEVIAHNTLELANWIADGDGKLCILLLDIKDGYKAGTNNSYIAGYFWMEDFFDRPNSNKRNIIYIDTYPGLPGIPESNRTLAHELQHMMNFVNRYAISWDDENFDFSYPHLMDTWIDEGLSGIAESIYSGLPHPEYEIEWFNLDPTGHISKGNNFFVWGNYIDEDPDAILDDYITVNLLFQWLEVHSGSYEIFRDIMTSPYPNYNYRAVTNAAGKHIGDDFYNWGTLLKTWLAANYINAPAGYYGYLDKPTLKDIKANTIPPGMTDKTIRLAPGEGVYSITNNFSMPGYQNNSIVKYAGLRKIPYELSDKDTFNGGALLTYNTNTNKNGSSINGMTTGVSANMEIDPARTSRQIISMGRPFAISADDMLRLNGHNKNIINE